MRRTTRLVVALLIAFALAPIPSDRPVRAALEAGCDEALRVDGIRWDGLPMEGFTWGGHTIDLEPIGPSSVVVCIAGGPPERLPITNSIGCLLVDGRLAMVRDLVACGAFRWIEREGDDTVLWIAHSSAATVDVTPFRWTGHELELGNTYPACGDQPRAPVGSSDDCFSR